MFACISKFETRRGLVADHVGCPFSISLVNLDWPCFGPCFLPLTLWFRLAPYICTYLVSNTGTITTCSTTCFLGQRSYELDVDIMSAYHFWYLRQDPEWPLEMCLCVDSIVALLDVADKDPAMLFGLLIQSYYFKRRLQNLRYSWVGQPTNIDPFV